MNKSVLVVLFFAVSGRPAGLLLSSQLCFSQPFTGHPATQVGAPEVTSAFASVPRTWPLTAWLNKAAQRHHTARVGLGFTTVTVTVTSVIT